MADLCQGCNEPPSSLKASVQPMTTQLTGVQPMTSQLCTVIKPQVSIILGYAIERELAKSHGGWKSNTVAEVRGPAPKVTQHLLVLGYLNQVTCPNRDSNPGHLVSQPDALTVTPQSVRLRVRPGKRHVLIRRFVRAVVETRSTIKDIKVNKQRCIQWRGKGIGHSTPLSPGLVARGSDYQGLMQDDPCVSVKFPNTIQVTCRTWTVIAYKRAQGVRACVIFIPYKVTPHRHLLGVQFKVCHGSLYAVMWLVDEPTEFNLPTLPQKCTTYVPEKLPSKYGVHSEEYLPIRTVTPVVAGI
ncbi:hypothetical protein ANN_12451 [Periplaneta americana]|uniref:Uncharacterized protein n=1 Tax=Periplaneta americana TaxID=6978 RepID=A0ABQ8TGJ1_PERAM|nr:hypothetical protein ANN_12451 [Periplaneta americana]